MASERGNQESGSLFDSGGFHSQYDPVRGAGRRSTHGTSALRDDAVSFDSGGFASEYDTGWTRRHHGFETADHFVPADDLRDEARFDSGGFTGEYDLWKRAHISKISEDSGAEGTGAVPDAMRFDSGGFRSEYDARIAPTLNGIEVLGESLVASNNRPSPEDGTKLRPGHAIRKAAAHGPFEYSLSKITATMLTIVLVGLVASVYLVRFGGSLGQYYRLLTDSNFDTTPYFSMEEFETVTPGMSRAEVRDILGYPLERYKAASDAGAERWVYTRPPTPDATSFTLCVVAFHRESGTVSFVRRSELRPTDTMLSSREPTYVRAMPKIRLIRPDGTYRRLEEGDGGRYVLVGVRETPFARPYVLAGMLDRVRLALMGAGFEGMEVLEIVHVPVQADEPAPPYRFVSTEPNIEEPLQAPVIALTPRPDAYYAYYYQDGRLHFLPGCEEGPFLTLTVEDMKWAIERMTKDRSTK